jgi:hypothetical protein
MYSDSRHRYDWDRHCGNWYGHNEGRVHGTRNGGWLPRWTSRELSNTDDSRPSSIIDGHANSRAVHR